MSLSTRTSYAAGHFDLQIDGHKSTAFVKSIDGGWSRANVVDDAVGTSPQRVKQISNVDVDPISVEFGLAGANDMLQWIKASWDRKYSRRNGQITHADFDMNATFEHEFFEAVITETTFPTLDGSSKDGGFLKCKMQPERVVTKVLPAPGPKLFANVTPKQKMWSPSAFRFTIDGIDEMEYTNKLDSFTIKQGIKKSFSGPTRFPKVEPTNIVFPNLTGTISVKHARPLFEWQQEYIKNQEGPGTSDPRAQKSGAIEFLSPDRKQVIFRINLYEVGLLFVGIEPSQANQEQIKRAKFEVYVHKMDIDGTGGLGFA
jgi:hypothetical protein